MFVKIEDHTNLGNAPLPTPSSSSASADCDDAIFVLG